MFDIFTNGHKNANLSKHFAFKQKKIAGPFKKEIFKVIISKKVAIPKKITSKKVLTNTQIFNSCFIDKIKNPSIHNNYKKSCLIKQVYNEKDKIFVLTQLMIREQTYNVYLDYYIWPLYKSILLLGDSSDSIVKFIISLHNVPEASTNSFATYYLNYKKKLEIILIELTHNRFFLWLLPKLILLPSISSVYITKFVTYHTHYKEKFHSNSTCIFACTT